MRRDLLRDRHRELPGASAALRAPFEKSPNRHVRFILRSGFACLNAWRASGFRVRGEAPMMIGPDYPGAVTAFDRFGFGARPGDLGAAPGDPRGFLLEELRTANVALIRDHAPPSGAEALTAYRLEQQQRTARTRQRWRRCGSLLRPRRPWRSPCPMRPWGLNPGPPVDVGNGG